GIEPFTTHQSGCYRVHIGSMPTGDPMTSSFALNDPSLLRQQCLIDGQWSDALSGKRLDVTNPANGETLASVPDMGEAETQQAVDAAERALPAWRALTAAE